MEGNTTDNGHNLGVSCFSRSSGAGNDILVLSVFHFVDDKTSRPTVQATGYGDTNFTTVNLPKTCTKPFNLPFPLVRPSPASTEFLTHVSVELVVLCPRKRYGQREPEANGDARPFAVNVVPQSVCASNFRSIALKTQPPPSDRARSGYDIIFPLT